MYETHVTIQGRLAADPTLRVTRDGVPYATFRLGQSARKPVREQPGAFADTDPSWYSVTAYRSVGTNAMASLHKGDPVTLYGKQVVKEFRRADGSTGIAVEVEALALGHDLRYGTSVWSKVPFGRGVEHGPSAGWPQRRGPDEPDLGDPEQVAYVVADGSGQRPEEAVASAEPAGQRGPASVDSGPLVRDPAEDAA